MERKLRTDRIWTNALLIGEKSELIYMTWTNGMKIAIGSSICRLGDNMGFWICRHLCLLIWISLMVVVNVCLPCSKILLLHLIKFSALWPLTYNDDLPWPWVVCQTVLAWKGIAACSITQVTCHQWIDTDGDDNTVILGYLHIKCWPNRSPNLRYTTCILKATCTKSYKRQHNCAS